MQFTRHTAAAALTGCHNKQAIPELLGRTLEACANNADDWQPFPGCRLAPAVKQTLLPLWALPKICTKTVITVLKQIHINAVTTKIITALIIDNLQGREDKLNVPNPDVSVACCNRQRYAGPSRKLQSWGLTCDGTRLHCCAIYLALLWLSLSSKVCSANKHAMLAAALCTS